MTHPRPSGRHARLLLALIIIIAVATHLGLAGYAIRNWHWSAAIVGTMAAVLFGKFALIVGYRQVRAFQRRYRTDQIDL